MTNPRFATVTSFGHSGSTIGIRFDRSRGEAYATLISSTGNPQRSAPEIKATIRATLSSDLARRIVQIEIDGSTLDDRVAVASEITGIAIRLAQTLLSQAAEAADVLAIGAYGCGIWDCRDSERSYFELLHAAALAEATGITVINEFPARDLAQGGLGGPVDAYGLWLLLADRTPVPGRRWRGAVEIGPNATQCTLISPFDSKAKKERLVASDICPGHRLFSSLASQTGESTSDADYGKLAAQGKVIAELSEIWSATGMTGLEWQPNGVSALPLLYALKDSTYRDSTLTDLLATATHYLAHEIANFIRHCVDHSRPVGELMIMGEGTRNGLLMHQLHQLLPAVQLRPLSDFEDNRSLVAASIAALALLHVWQIPLMPSRGGVPRVLGQLTPGNPNNWQRVLNVMTTNSPWLLPLREAI